MILSKQSLFSAAQAITATAVSENIYDFGPAGIIPGEAAAVRGDAGKGNEIPLLVQVVESFNTLTSLAITIEVDDNSAFSSPTVKYTSGAIVLASLVAGYKLPIQVVPLGINERYMRFVYTVTGTNPTLGKITAGFTLAVSNRI